MLVPGEFHFRSIHLDGTDENVHWQVELKSTVLHPDLLMLLRRNLVVHELHGDGVTVSIKEHPESEIPRVIARLKEGFSPHTDPNWLPWRITIQKILLEHVNSIQMNKIRYSGNSEITGAFMLLPGTELEILNSQWLVKNGEMFRDQERLIDEMSGDSKVTIHLTDLTRTAGNQIFKTMDIRQQLYARVYSSDFFGVLITPYNRVVESETVGSIKTDLDIRNGVLQPPSEISANFDQMVIHFLGASLLSKGKIKWVAKAASPKNIGLLTIPLENLRWEKNKTTLAYAKNFFASSESTELSLMNLFADQRMKLKAKNIHLAPLGKIVKALNTGSTATSHEIKTGDGVLDLDAQFFPAGKEFGGKVQYRTSGLSVSYNQGKTHLDSEAKVVLEVYSPHYDQGTLMIKNVQADLQKMKIFFEGKETYSSDDWKVNFAMKEGTFYFKDATELDGRFTLGMTNLRVPIRFAVPDKFAVKLGLFLFPMNDFRGSGHLFLDENLFKISDFHAHTSSGTIEASLQSSEAMNFGALFPIGSTQLCFSQFHISQPDLSFSEAEKKCRPTIQSIDQTPPKKKKRSLVSNERPLQH